MDTRKKTQHEIAVDRALPALATEVGSQSVKSHLTSPVDAPSAGRFARGPRRGAAAISATPARVSQALHACRSGTTELGGVR